MFKKTILTVLGTALCLQSATASNFTASDVIEVFAGVMNGIVHEDHLDYLLGCMNGTEALVTDMEDAVADFEEGTFWSITAGILDLKQFIADIPPTLSNCGGIPDDFAKLGNFFSIFGNTTLLTERVTYNMLWYYSDIETDLGQALTYWNQADYFDFGDKVGDALVLAVGDHSSESL
jgi:hypothetical protein